MKRLLLPLLATVATVLAQAVPAPGPANIGDAEVQKVEEKIAMVRRDMLSKYEMSLGELQIQFQKVADLEGALAARAERDRVHTEQTLSEKNFANDPKSLRVLQQSTLSKMQELISGVVAGAVPRLVEFKKQLTVDGRLDDAIAIKQAIERVQNANVPVSRAEPGSIVPAETLLQAYGADRSRADKTYKNVRISVRGVVGGYRIDPDNGKSLLVYLTGGSSTGWVQCAFNLGLWRYREEKAGAAVNLVLIPKEGSEVRVTKGQQMDILGDCGGWDELVKLTKCDVPR